MTDKDRKIDFLNRMETLLNGDSIDVLYDEAWAVVEAADEQYDESEIEKGHEAEFYSKMMTHISELYEIRNEITLLKNLLKE